MMNRSNRCILIGMLVVALLCGCGGRELKYREGKAASLAERMVGFVDGVKAKQTELSEEQWTLAAETFDKYVEEASTNLTSLSPEDKRRVAHAAGQWARMQGEQAASEIESMIETANQMLPAFLDGISSESK